MKNRINHWWAKYTNALNIVAGTAVTLFLLWAILKFPNY